jgi:hypothetical protein
LQRAASSPEAKGEPMVRAAALLLHPAVMAAFGYSALLERVSAHGAGQRLWLARTRVRSSP